MSRFPLLLMLGWSACLQAQTPVLERVLQAELAFARQADKDGIARAFRTWLTEDAKVFSPRLSTRQDQYGQDPGDPGHLSWYPEAMGISAANDLAWSLGPWTYAPKKGAPILVHGHFLSVWHRQANGSWRVVADIGVPHAAPERPIEPFPVWDASRTPGKPVPKGLDPAPAIRQKEAELASSWAAKGGLALMGMLAKGARVLRPGFFPVPLGGDLPKALAGDRPGCGWEVTTVQAASGGDLAWTCGETTPDDQGRRASFLRVWSLESGEWKVLFDVRLPHPETPK